MLKMLRPPLRSFPILKAALALAAALLAFAPLGARADEWHGHGHGHGHAHYRYWAPGFYGGFVRPGFYGPPVVYAPGPAYYAPPPAYYVAPPVYYAPAPPAYYAAPPVYGYGPPGVSVQFGFQIPIHD